MSLIARLFVLCLCAFSLTAQAATIYVDPAFKTLNRGDAMTTAVRIMPDREASECINVIDAVLTYSDNIQPVDVSIGKSILNVWVESPKINREEHTITFAGGIPNGYCGRVDGDPGMTNILAEIVFRSPGLQVGGSDDNQAFIDFAPETQALLNDGQGTRAPLNFLGSVITLEKTPSPEGITDDWRESVREDNTPPEEFSIVLTKDDVAFNGSYFIVFSTSDKQTGISHYEVMEESVTELGRFAWGGVGVPWVTTNSPYVLDDQSLNSVIRVKAVDKAGNEYVATLVPDETMRTMSTNQILTYVSIGIGGLIILLLVFGFWYFFKKRRIKQLEDVSENDNGLVDDEN